jgi:hypothetical protein
MFLNAIGRFHAETMPIKQQAESSAAQASQAQSVVTGARRDSETESITSAADAHVALTTARQKDTDKVCLQQLIESLIGQHEISSVNALAVPFWEQVEPHVAPVAEGQIVPNAVERKRVEKFRLMRIFKRFVNEASAGCPCVYLKESTRERCQTQYSIDNSFRYLLVRSTHDPARAEVAVPVAAIQDIYTMKNDSERHFPSGLISELSPEDKQLMLMVVYRNSQQRDFRVCLLVDSSESRDHFLECFRILCIYAKSTQGPPAAV